MKKIVSGVVAVLILTGMLTFTLDIKPAKSAWTGTVILGLMEA